MLPQVVFSVAVAFVYGGNDQQMAQVLDQSTFERGANDVGFVISYRDGIEMRAPVQSLATLSGASLQPHRGTGASDREGALEMALAMLEQTEATPKFLMVVGDDVPAAFVARARRMGVAVSSVDAPKHELAHYTIRLRGRCRPDAPEDASRLPLFGAFALLGLAGLIGRRQLF